MVRGVRRNRAYVVHKRITDKQGVKTTNTSRFSSEEDAEGYIKTLPFSDEVASIHVSREYPRGRRK